VEAPVTGGIRRSRTQAAAHAARGQRRPAAKDVGGVHARGREKAAEACSVERLLAEELETKRPGARPMGTEARSPARRLRSWR
jgi:hypothetical protein